MMKNGTELGNVLQVDTKVPITILTINIYQCRSLSLHTKINFYVIRLIDSGCATTVGDNFLN